MRSTTFYLLTVLVLTCSGCIDFAPIEASVCGNLIVEPGEACDGPDEQGNCRAPGQPSECQFECNDGANCPAGLVCGTGSLCLAPNECGNGVVETGEDCDGSDDCREADQPFPCKRECTTDTDCGVGHRCLAVGICDNQNVCGNGVVEAGEECDGTMPEGDHSCRPPSDAHPCRFDCSTAACPAGYHCSEPSIGGDALCRKPSGTFSLLNTIEGNSDGILTAHFDDDGRIDLLKMSEQGVRLHYFDRSGDLVTTTDLRITSTAPVLGDVDKDGVTDLAFRVPSAFLSDGDELVLALTRNRTIAVSTQLTEQLPGRPVALNILAPVQQSDLLFITGQSIRGFGLAPDTQNLNDDKVGFGLETNLFDLKDFPDAIPFGVTTMRARPLKVAPCRQMAAVWENFQTVVTMSPCASNTQPYLPAWNNGALPPQLITLAGDAYPASAPQRSLDGVSNPGGAIYAGRVNADNKADLLVPSRGNSGPTCGAVLGCPNADPTACACVGCVDDGICDVATDDCICNDCAGTPECVFSCNLDGLCDPFYEPCSCSDCAAHAACSGLDSVQVAYQTEDGTFHSAPPIDSVTPGLGNNTTSRLPVKLVPNFSCPDQGGPLGALWLGVDDFNGDGRVDIVNQIGVFISANDDSTYTFGACPTVPWDEAVIADFDGNGTRDIIATYGGSNLVLLRGTDKGTFSELVMDAGGFAHNLVAGDFDGDTVDDLAFVRSQNATIGPNDQTQIVVAYGTPLQTLSAPTVVGSESNITRVVAGTFSPGDNISDLLVQTSGAEGRNTAILRGSVSRELVSGWVSRNAPPEAYATHLDVTSVRAVAIGTFAASNEGTKYPIAALTDRHGANQRMQTLSFDANMRLDQIASDPFACTGPNEICSSRQVTAIDLNANGVDEVVTLSDQQLLVFPEGVMSGMPATLETSFDLFKSGRNSRHTDYLSRARVADVDGDTHSDLLVLAADQTVRILWGTGSGTLDPSVSTEVTTTDPIRAFATLDNALDSKLEVIVASGDQLIVFTIDKDRKAIEHAKLDGFAGVDQLATGDIDGDGMDDLVTADALRFNVYRSVEVSP